MLILEEEPRQFSLLLLGSLDIRQRCLVALPSAVNLRLGDRCSTVEKVAYTSNPV